MLCAAWAIITERFTMKTTYRIETFVNDSGNCFFAKIVDGKCVFFFSVANKDKAEQLFMRVMDGYDPSKDKRRCSEINPDNFYKEFIKKTEGSNPTVRRGPYCERGQF